MVHNSHRRDRYRNSTNPDYNDIRRIYLLREPDNIGRLREPEGTDNGNGKATPRTTDNNGPYLLRECDNSTTDGRRHRPGCDGTVVYSSNGWYGHLNSTDTKQYSEFNILCNTDAERL